MFEDLVKKTEEKSEFVFFTGAGISTDSGIKDFRSCDGLYSEGLYGGYEPEEILSRKVLMNEPDIFFRYYNDKIIAGNPEPNMGHKAIADIQELGIETTVVTQNIDGLHSKAGSFTVHELHGSVLKNYCTSCNRFFDLDFIKSFKGSIPKCPDCKSMVRPDVVLYGEGLHEEEVKVSVEAIERADFLFAVGSSLRVYPAAGFLRYFRGKAFIIINIGQTPFDRIADCKIEENSSYVLGQLCRELKYEFG